MSATQPIDHDIAALREALSQKPVRAAAIAAGLPERTIQNFRAGAQPSVKTIRLLQSVRGSTPKKTGAIGTMTEDEARAELIGLGTRAALRAASIDATSAHINRVLDRHVTTRA